MFVGRQAWRRVGGVIVGVALGVGAAGAAAVRRQAPWVPWSYLIVMLALFAVLALVVRWRSGPRPWRIATVTTAAMVLVALSPVPWMTAALAEPPGTAWRLDGRLTIDGQRIDPAGDWYWLTVGRPPLVAEVVTSWFTGSTAPATLRRGGTTSRPAFNEPAAAAVGLRAAGRPIALTLLVEASDPIAPHLPHTARIVELNGVAVTSRDEWQRALDSLDGDATFVDADGTTHRFTGTDIPYRRTVLLDTPVEPLDAGIRGPLAGTPPEAWFRGLALGRSHGLMIALVAYAHESGLDLAGGRAIAGTGGIRGDGTVTRIRGLRAKADAAARAGVDVMFFPADQASDLDGFDPGSMRLVPVSHLDDAIAALRA